VAWPSPQDYNEAIQAPRLCFIDPSLRAGTLALNKFGLPIAISGGFASVYQLTLPNAGGKWAIRCFLSAVDNQQRRYSEISKTLITLKLPYTVHFRYQAPGIRVNGREFPIVSMEWLAGDLFGDYIQVNHFDPVRMGQLASKWVAMIATLRAHKIAHGDLQHGNILVVNQELKLIDYDGMHVPALATLQSTEDGHPNYQHPKRKGLFNPDIDNFSAWVVYCSLRILELDPNAYHLARRLGRDECILFNRDDFANPSLSRLFRHFRNHSDLAVAGAAACIERLAKMDVRLVPPLDPQAIEKSAAVPATTLLPENEWWKTPKVPMRPDRFSKSPFEKTSVAAATPVPPAPPPLERVPWRVLSALAVVILLILTLDIKSWTIDHAAPFVAPLGEIALSSNLSGVTYSVVPAGTASYKAPLIEKRGTGQTSVLDLRGFKFGAYTIAATAPGWRLPRTIEVTLDGTEAVPVNFAFRRASVSFESTPSGASVLEGGAVLGTTPLVLARQTAEKHTYTLKFLDWDPFSTTVDLLAAKHAVTHVWPHGIVRLESRPAGAHVLQDGEDLGVTPLDLPVARTGPAKYEFQQSGYESQALSGIIEDGKRLFLSAELMDNSHMVSVEIESRLDPHMVTLKNLDSVPLKVFMEELYDRGHHLREVIPGPWLIPAGGSLDVSFRVAQDPTDLVTLETNPRHLAVLHTKENLPVGAALSHVTAGADR
jgi:hypothetical protein